MVPSVRVDGNGSYAEAVVPVLRGFTRSYRRCEGCGRLVPA